MKIGAVRSSTTTLLPAVLLSTSHVAAFARNAAAPWNPNRFQEEELEEEELTFEDFGEAIGYWGYQWEPYEVTTRDGLQLTLFRIVAGPPDGFVKPELPSSSSSDEDEEE